MYELIIRNGTIIDGLKTPRYQADVGVTNGRIHAIGDLSGATAVQTLDAQGKIVAPGFIDVHNHSDAWLLKKPHFESKTRQGFTSEVIMADGIGYAPLSPEMAYDWIYYQHALNGLEFSEYSGWQTIEAYMALLDGATVQNSITHIPYANLRIMAAGYGRAVPDDYQMRHILQEIEIGMAAGAVGLSNGLDYVTQAFAKTDEFVEVCRRVGELGGIYVSHIRYKKGMIPALKEAVEIGRRANIPVHISHLKGSNEKETEAIINYIDTVAVNEVDFTFDTYPYISSSTMLNYLLPKEVWEDGPLNVISKLKQSKIRRRFTSAFKAANIGQSQIAWVRSKANAKFQGYTLEAYANALNLPPEDAFCNLLIEENLSVLLVFFFEENESLYPMLTHDKFMMGTDGIYHEEGMIHPRQYGSTGRFLGRFARDAGLMDLETAVFKMSSFPAQRFGLKDRGVLQEGAFADIVVFDASTIIDKATPDTPHQMTEGVEHLIVNGTPVIENQEIVDLGDRALPGRALKYQQ
ncbi:MAG: amidohydrolase family protein [Chloroflexota bacterium]